MPFDLWGANATPQIVLPQRPLIGYFLLALYLLAFGALLVNHRADWRQLRGGRRWLWTLLLALASLLLSQTFTFSFATRAPFALSDTLQSATATGTPFGLIPILLAAITLNPTAALLVGFFSGLGRALWQTHQVLTPFHFAFAGIFLSWTCRQPYTGRFYAWLRRPLVSGPLTLLLTALLIAPATFAYIAPNTTSLSAFDLALSTAWTYLPPLLLEAILSSLAVTLLLVGLPRLLPPPAPSRPSPQSRSLRWRLLGNFFLFALILIFLLLIVVYNVAVLVSQRLVLNQMAYNAQTVSSTIPDFLAQRQNLLVQYSQEPDWLTADAATQTQTLRQLFRSGPLYRRVILADSQATVRAAYPNDATNPLLTSLERAAVAEAISTRAFLTSAAQVTAVDGYTISFIVPVPGSDGQPQAALIGRAPETSLMTLIAGLQGTRGEGIGFLVDSAGQIIAHPRAENLLTIWKAPISGPRPVNDTAAAFTYEGRAAQTNARELVVYVTGQDHPWTVVTAVPYEVVLGLALTISAPMASVLLLAAALFAINLIYLSRSITQPLGKLGQAAGDIAAGNLDTSVTVKGEDEIGQLGRAFEQMQRSLQKRLDELSLLLGVSQDVAAHIDIRAGMPALLQGAIRGTGAAGVRIVVLNPNHPHPLTFGEGPAAADMAAYDRQLMSLTRQHGEQRFSSAAEIQAALTLPTDQPPPPGGPLRGPLGGLIAIPIRGGSRFQGVLVLGYRQPRQFAESELNLLHTLAGLAAVQVINGFLFASAEGGRRRLAAVLASTSDAVIVTDQTERVLLVNPAMERAFALPVANTINQPVRRVIQLPRLRELLTEPIDRSRQMEIETESGNTWYANAATIISNSGQVMGRVVVLHDITTLKEVDRLKSEFVQTVSHDLRSPLTFMQGYATMLPMVGDLNEQQQVYATKIKAGIEQMTVLVNNLLDLGRIEAGVDLVLSDVDVEQLIQAIVRDYETPAAEAGLNYVVEIPAKLPPLHGDAGLIRQALSNLVGNTIKYAPQSGAVVIRAAQVGEEVIVSVRDRGPGISRQDQAHLFEKFFRIKERRTERVKGSGLGLAIVHSIAERHGGRVWCESTLGEGSTFFLALPVRLASVA
ncbi:MAG: HAMP domain-containing protein [Anaerolineales bacterium]|nr:HAMP domain-containing protein [Anaerolineales bacterium]